MEYLTTNNSSPASKPQNTDDEQSSLWNMTPQANESQPSLAQLDGSLPSKLPASASISPPKEFKRRPYTKPKNSTRKKANAKNLEYKCKECEKIYHTYPALYTHFKLKHSGQASASTSNVRRRGRPKKMAWLCG